MSAGAARVHSTFILSAFIIKASEMPGNIENGWLGSKLLPLSQHCHLEIREPLLQFL